MILQIRAFNGPSDWGWVKQHLPLLRVEDTCGLMAIDEEKNETVGAVIFDNFLNNSAQAHIILTTPMILKYGFLEECFEFLFERVGKEYMYGMVHEKNEKALKLNKHLGFTEKTRMKDGYLNGVDFIVMELHRDNCPLYQKRVPLPIYEVA